jgi:large subunit ribosomal protein L10
MREASINKIKKIAQSDALSDFYASQDWLFLISYTGLDAADTQDLRSKLRAVNGTMKIVKNKINSFALQNTKFASLSARLGNQVAVVLAVDPVSVAKTLNEFVKEDKISVIAYGDGVDVKDGSSLGLLSDLPTFDVLRATLLRTLLAPATKIVRVLSEPYASLARVLDAHEKQNG